MLRAIKRKVTQYRKIMSLQEVELMTYNPLPGVRKAGILAAQLTPARQNPSLMHFTTISSLGCLYIRGGGIDDTFDESPFLSSFVPLNIHEWYFF